MVESVHRGQIWADFVNFWQRFIAETELPGTVVVVEGEKDRRALRRLGVRGRITPLHDGRRLSGVAQSLARRGARVVVLTDWDSEGGHFAHRLKGFLQAEHIDFDLDLRRRLARILRGEIVHVEGLAGWARRTAELQGAPLEHFLDPNAGLPDVVDGRAPTE